MTDQYNGSLTSRLCFLSLFFALASHPHSASSQTLNQPITLAEGDNQAEYVSEDLNELSLAAKPLAAARPLAGGTMKTQQFTRELLELQWRGGDPIDVYIIRPAGVAKPPVTIYLYGYPVDANRFTNDEFCRLITRSGAAAIGFVPALTGQRYHDVPMKTWFVSEMHDSIVKTVHDEQMLVNYAQTRPDLDATHVTIFGQGAGATIAGLAATVDPRITAVDLLDPWGDWPGWMASSTLVPEEERAQYLKPQYLDSLAPFDPVRWLPLLAGRPLKVDDALYETGTPVASKRKIDAALPSSGLLIRYATKTEFDSKAVADGKLLDWIQQQNIPSAVTSTNKGSSTLTKTSFLNGGATSSSASQQGESAYDQSRK